MISKKIMTAFVLFALVAVVLSSSIAQAVEVGSRTDVNYTRNEQEDAENQGAQPNLDVIWVKINGDVVENGDEIRTDYQKDQKIEVKVEMLARDNADNVVVEARISGSDHSDVADVSETFDVKNGTMYIKTLQLELPASIDSNDYDLRVSIIPRTGAMKTYNYLLAVTSPKHSISIRDVTFNPSEEVMAGRSLLSVVRIQNFGAETEDSVKIKVDIPELNQYAVDYVDELESDDSVSSEEMYLRIPSTAKTGEYDVVVTAEYDDGYKQVEKTYQINVVGTGSEDDSGSASTSGSKASGIQITAGPQTQETARGQGGVIYPVAIVNSESESKSISLYVTGVESFGTVKVSPSTLIVVGPGASETFYVYVSANEDASLGSHTFGVSVKSNNEVLKEFPLNVNVIEGSQQKEAASWDSVKKGLLVGLVILIVILVILGLIIAFNKIKGSEDESEEDDGASQTYY
jgi:uncharacterized membrane protein